MFYSWKLENERWCHSFAFFLQQGGSARYKNTHTKAALVRLLDEARKREQERGKNFKSNENKNVFNSIAHEFCRRFDETFSRLVTFTLFTFEVNWRWIALFLIKFLCAMQHWFRCSGSISCLVGQTCKRPQTGDPPLLLTRYQTIKKKVSKKQFIPQHNHRYGCSLCL